MLSDPQTLIVNANTLSVPAIGRGLDSSVYKLGTSVTNFTGECTLTVSHQYKRRNRFVVRLDFNTNTADPFVPANYVRTSASVYVVIDVPADNTIPYTTTVAYMVTALADWLKAGTHTADVIGGST